MDKISSDVLADARRVRNLYRRSFANTAKAIARRRVVDALRAAGVTVVLDLWGGGSSADFLVAAGFRVISIENGSMKLEDQGIPVSTERKRRAHEIAGLEGGYETFWGEVWEAVAAYPEATGAYLDFCGPWTETTRRAVESCRTMECACVTLTPVRDIETSGWTRLEREWSYQLVLKMAWAEKPRWEAINGAGSVRRLFDYRNPGSVPVFVYLLSHRWLKLPVVPLKDRIKTRPDMRDRVNATSREWYRNQPAEVRKQINDKSRHNDHLRTGRLPVKPCSICGLQREPDYCACGDVIPFSRAIKGATYCSESCMKQAKLTAQRLRNEQKPRMTREASCVRCGKSFQPADGNNLRKPLCGSICREANIKEYKAEWYQQRKLAAVSGTTAEAVSSEEAD